MLHYNNSHNLMLLTGLVCLGVCIHATYASYVPSQTNQANDGYNPVELHETIRVLKYEEALDPSDSQIQFQLGLAFQLISSQQNDSVNKFNSEALEKAETAYRKCLELDPDHPDALTNLGKLLSDRSFDKLNPEIIALYERAFQSSPTHLQSQINLGLLYHGNKKYHEAVDVYHRALKHHPSSAEIRYKLAVTLRHLGDIQESASQYERTIQLDPYHLPAIINLAALHHQYGSVDDAIWYNQLALTVFFKKIEITCNVNKYPSEFLTNMGEKFMDLYDIIIASDLKLHQAIAIHSPIERSSNTSSSNQHYDHTIRNTPFFSNVLNDVCFQNNFYHLIMVLPNLGQAFMEKKSINAAIACHILVIMILQAKLDELKAKEPNQRAITDIEEISEIQKIILHSKVFIFKSAQTGCKWITWDWLDSLVINIEKFELQQGEESSLMPFDTLGLSLSPMWKKRVAIRHSHQVYGLEDSQERSFTNLHEYNSTQKLRLGFLSHDFNDHPTAHLMEGLFYWNNISSSSMVEFVAYSYGKNDNSTYRKKIESLVGGDAEKGGNFFDLSAFSYDDTVKTIHEDKPHIVFDLQGYTRGGRPEITSKRVAPIQVNYLVYPGTSGANFIDYIVGDKYVIPPEHANYYTEKIVMLPKSYQANHYREHSYLKTMSNNLKYNNKKENKRNDFMNINDTANQFRHQGWPFVRGSKEWKLLRISAGLEPSPSLFVFANFNKQDKLDPGLFSVWMQILISVPNSILWLLEPFEKNENEDKSLTIIYDLRIAASASGVNPTRIVFAPRVSKEKHIRRMAAADLFLDSFTYGAHSTATDALMAGLPVLTINGDSFASRVGVSLLRNTNLGIGHSLVTFSVKDYTNVAIQLARNSRIKEKSLLSILRQKLETGIDSSDLVDGEYYLKDFQRLSQALWELYTIAKHLESKMHIIIPESIK